MARLPPDIIRIVRLKMTERPNRSARCPSTTPPSGRNRNPTAYTAKAESSAVVGPRPAGKNRSAKNGAKEA